MSIFSHRIKKLRGNMSIDELVTRLNEKYQTKISKSMISRYENGQADPKMETVRIFADFFNVSADYLMGIKDNIQIDTTVAHHDRDDQLNFHILDLLYDLFDDKRLQPIPKTKIENGVQKILEELYEEHQIQPNIEISNQILNEYADYPNIKIIPDHLLKEVFAIKGTSLKRVLCKKLRSLDRDYKFGIEKDLYDALHHPEGGHKNESNSRNIIKLEDIIEQDNISYKGRQLTNPDRSRILNMLEILFPEN